MKFVLALTVALFAASVSATSVTCTCTSTANTCSLFLQTCASSSSYGAAGTGSCVVGQTGATCVISGSGSCPDTNTGLAACGIYCYLVNALSGYTYSCSSGSCFPGNATVQLEDGSSKTMSALEIGDKVLTENGEYSDVYMFSHRLTDIRSAFVRIAAGGHSLMLTANHYLYVNDKLAVASTVKVGDKVKGHDGSDITVTSVEAAWADGLYNPHTMNGDIVVDGILTSTYTSDINPSLAHAALWPVRMLHSLGQNVVGEAFHAGSELLASVLPDGKARY